MATTHQQDDSGPIPFDDTHPGIDAQTLALINEKFDRGSKRMRRHELAIEDVRAEVGKAREEIKVASAEMKENTALTREMNDSFQFAKSGYMAIAKFGRGMAMIGRGIVRTLKWLSPLAVAYLAIKHDLGELVRGVVDLIRKH